MAVTLTRAKIRLLVTALLENGGVDFSTVKQDVSKSYQTAFTNGTGANQGSMVFVDTRSLATGANEDLDLAGGLTSAFGTTLTLTAVKAIIIVASTANTTNLTVSRPASNGVPFLAAAADAFVLKPGGMFMLTDPSAAGITITAATGDLINVTNASGATASYDVLLIAEAS